MPSELAPWLADGLIVLGLIVMTLGVIGVIRMPDVYTKLHAASKSVVFGVCSFLLATAARGDATTMTRALLSGVFLLVTAPGASHEIARAALRERRAPTADSIVVRERPMR